MSDKPDKPATGAESAQSYVDNVLRPLLAAAETSYKRIRPELERILTDSLRRITVVELRVITSDGGMVSKTATLSRMAETPVDGVRSAMFHDALRHLEDQVVNEIRDRGGEW